jgi:hypothetical protein
MVNLAAGFPHFYGFAELFSSLFGSGPSIGPQRFVMATGSIPNGIKSQAPVQIARASLRFAAHFAAP